MNYNLVSGWGSIEAQVAAATKNTTGKIFVVAASTVAGYDKLQQLFGFRGDPEGTLRFFNTIDAAINATTAARGDVILVAPGHAETLTTAGAIALDVQGVSVIGLGNGDNRPVITLGSTDNTASITMGGDDCALKNIVLVGNDDALTNALNVTGNDADIDIESQDTSDAIEMATVIRLDTADNAKVKLRHNGFATGNAMVSCIRLDNCANVQIDIKGYGVLTTAWVEMVDVASTNVSVNGEVYTSGVTDGTRNVVDTITGSTWDARVWDRSAAAMQRGGSGEALAFDDVGDIASAIGLAAQDAVTNADIGDQVGNKTDTAVADTIEGNAMTTQSLNRLIKAALQRLGADSANNTAATTLVGANRDGSILERLEDLRQNESSTGGFVYQGACDAGMGASTTAIVSADLAGHGDDFFNTKYYMQVLLNVNSVGNAPEFEVRQITDYVSATGTFTVTAFSVNVEASDQILVMHESYVALGRDDGNNTFASTNVVGNADGSVLERLETIQAAAIVIDEFHDVPGADSAANSQINEVIGNKTDTNAGDSLLARHLVQTADAATNVNMRDVVGNKADAAAAGAVSATESLMAYCKQLVTELQVVDGIVDDVLLDTAVIGTVVNTGGTATVGGVLGDFANDSLVARLNDIGSDVDSAVTSDIQGKLGTDTEMADRSLYDQLNGGGPAAAAAATAPGNDVSLYAVLREVYDQSEKAVTNTTATLVDGTTIFTVAGGPIEILSLVARCATINDATGSTLQWRADPTDGALATFSAASGSLASLNPGAMVVLQGNTLATAPIVNATGVGLGQTVTNGIVVGAGVIQIVVGVGSTTGTWQHHMRYRPLSRGVTVS